MRMRKWMIAAALVITLPAAETLAQDNDAFVPPCSVAPYTDFDFWVGDWIAFDYDSGVVFGYDSIEKTQDGCVVHQNWTQLTDRFRVAGSPSRYTGESLNSVLADGQWNQVWAGSGGSTIIVSGGLDEQGRMVLRSGELTAASGALYQNTWYWDLREDGTIHSWGEVRILDDVGNWGDPQIQWNIRYVSRHDVRNLVEVME